MLWIDPIKKVCSGVGGRQDKDLTEAVCRINREHGKDAIQLAMLGLPQEREWEMKRQKRSPRYTVRWDELFTVEA